MRTAARALRRLLPPALLVASLLPWLGGCPTLSLRSVTVKDGSVSASGFTLQVAVDVTETEDPAAAAAAEALTQDLDGNGIPDVQEVPLAEGGGEEGGVVGGLLGGSAEGIESGGGSTDAGGLLGSLGAADPNAGLSSGRGLVGLYLPQGWKVRAARVQSPQESAVRAMYAAPQTAVSFAESFPRVPGEWWAYASSQQAIPKGSWTYLIEFDVETPKKPTAGPVGVAVGVFTENAPELPAPNEYRLRLLGKGGRLEPVLGGEPAGGGPAMPEGDLNEKASGG
jgi:hypothetical protein